MKWKVMCKMCEMHVWIDAKIITSEDNCAVFIEVPDFHCGKCQSTCVKELYDKDGNQI